MHQACTILMAHIAEEAIRQQGTNKVLSIYPLSGFDLRYHVGLFRRAGEEHLYEATHPIRLFGTRSKAWQQNPTPNSTTFRRELTRMMISSFGCLGTPP